MPSAHPRHRRRRTRSRSPEHKDRASRRSRRGSTTNDARKKNKKEAPVALLGPLPFSARLLSKHADYTRLRPMFALYLDIQKQKAIEDLPADEVKGRWKSFVGKWNRGGLAEGWYDPATLERAIASAAENDKYNSNAGPRLSPGGGGGGGTAEERSKDDDDDSDSDGDEFGPAAMSATAISTRARRSGPAIPRIEDLQYRDELVSTAANIHHRTLRAADRAEQRDRLAELVPRTDPGTREHRAERRADAAATLNAFRDAKDGTGGVDEVGDADLMGTEDGFKARRREQERRKTEREIRREEMLRARAEQREERRAEYRAKEDKTMEMLRGLARANFGGGGGGGGGGGENRA